MRPFTSPATPLVAAASSVALAACLSQTHVIPAQDLLALADMPPEERGRRVRVIQSFEADDQPPSAPPVSSGTLVVVGPPVRVTAPRLRLQSARAKTEDARAWLVIAAAVAAGLAVTEGMRYDGWVAVHPMHPVHMYGPMGEYSWVPLAQLTWEMAAWSQKAMIRESEGPWQRLERAPLDRAGWTYGLSLGSAELVSFGGQKQPGFLGHIQVGRFPSQEVGILFDLGWGWRRNHVGAMLFDSRYAMELQFFPLTASPLHAGLYGQLGVDWRIEDRVPTRHARRALVGGGGLIQLELTTRLALTARAGLSFLEDTSSGEVCVGMAIY